MHTVELDASDSETFEVARCTRRDGVPAVGVKAARLATRDSLISRRDYGA